MEVASQGDLDDVKDKFNALLSHLKLHITFCPEKYPKGGGVSNAHSRYGAYCEACKNTDYVFVSIEDDDDDDEESD